MNITEADQRTVPATEDEVRVSDEDAEDPQWEERQLAAAAAEQRLRRQRRLRTLRAALLAGSQATSMN